MAFLDPEQADAAVSSSSSVRGAYPERLSHAERSRLAFEIVAAYAHARRALRRAPIGTVVAELRSSPSSATQPPHPLHEARRLGRAVARLLAYVPGDTRCLVRSLVLTRLLANRGIEAKLVVGVQTEPEFLAHAWVEHHGHPVLNPGDASLGRLVEL
jgi:hypothetical protein